jgi:hypothetical protein
MGTNETFLLLLVRKEDEDVFLYVSDAVVDIGVAESRVLRYEVTSMMLVVSSIDDSNHGWWLLPILALV